MTAAKTFVFFVFLLLAGAAANADSPFILQPFRVPLSSDLGGAFLPLFIHLKILWRRHNEPGLV